MSSKRGSSFFRTVTLRLTLLHAGLFASLSFATFVLVYLTLQANLMRRADNELREDAREAESNLLADPSAAGRDAFAAGVDPADINKEVHVLLSPRSEMLVSSSLDFWSGVEFAPPELSRLVPGDEALRTIYAPSLGMQARLIVRRAPDGSLIEIGTALGNNADLLRTLREIFAFGWAATIVPGLLLGWFIARRAMVGVNRVTATAVGIGKSDLTQRVPVGNESEEIENLARAFNDMLDRIHLLVRELEDVSTSIAHDLKSPITRIRGVAEGALSSTAHTQQNDTMAALVIDECDRLVAMVDTILEIAATDAGVATLGTSPIDIGHVASDAVDLFRPMAEDSGVHLQMELPPSALLVRGDLSRVQRVVSNLLDNAIKYTERGGTVRITAATAADCISLSIRDSGIGIDAESLPRVFERFYRADQSRSTSGHGLGLSLARAIVRAHGGEIAVQSVSGQGSVFTIQWPAWKSPADVSSET